MKFHEYYLQYKTRYVHRGYVYVIDVAAGIISSVLAFLISTLYWGNTTEYSFLAVTVFLSLIASGVSTLFLRTYVSAMRFTTLEELWRLFAASLLKGALMFILMTIVSTNPDYRITPKENFAVEVTDIFINVCALITIRIMVTIVYKLILRTKSSDQLYENILIYGDAPESASVAGLLDKSEDFRIRGFVVLDKVDSGKKAISNHPIFHVQNDLQFKKIVTSETIDIIVFPDYASARKEQDRLLTYCAKHNVETRVCGGISTLNKSGAILPPLKEIKIEDLLGREEVYVNMNEIRDYLTDKVVLVTGAAGSIGSEICRQLLKLPIQQLVMFDQAETPMHDLLLEMKDINPFVSKKYVIGDVRDNSKLEYVFSRYSPNVVFHAAAYKHVPMMENNPVEAVNTNVFGTKNVAQMAIKYSTEKFVMISTDKAVNPANVMGASKRIAEIYVQSLSLAVREGRVQGITRFVTTRFGNVLGSNGSVIPLFKKQIAAGGPVTVTDPRIIRYFMTIPEACRLVLEAGSIGKGEEIFVFDMGEPVKIIDLARNMITLAGLEVEKDIKIESVGLRPGEKLYEELLNNKEDTLPTVNDKIFLAKARRYDLEEVEKSFEALKQAASTIDKDEIVRQMKLIVPEFKSNNSRYGKFDK